ncbi:cytochrome P450 [Aminobacter niigataensis]|uniref:cytochrome P450 n=1 Tax=Aminobacter niigataensis TaxID=83265 RepID=UPI0024CDEF2A|nr:cytochrome P450 [Aminobacter niigataensis]CAI2933791.1 Cytochrome P450 [Aminobacter niigataensis]
MEPRWLLIEGRNEAGQVEYAENRRDRENKMIDRPESDVDLFTTEVMKDPYPVYRMLRDLGPAVWLTKHQVWCITRYEGVKRVLGDYRTFTTSKGVAMDPAVNEATSGPGRANSLTSDPPLHDEIRRVTGAPLTPRALAGIKEQIETTARNLVDDLCKRRTVDGMVDVAQVLPLTIVSEMVGLPEEGKKSMLRWAAATFNAMGPMNELGSEALPQIRELHQFCINDAVPGKLKADGWADRIYQAAARGEIPAQQCPGMMREYIGPSLDTTIFATGHLLRHLGDNPDQWQLLRNNRSLLPGAINEALRMEAPIRLFSRYVRAESTFDEIVIPEGARLLVLYASANRDERKWQDPDRFDITRRNGDHVAFGFGIHTCAGMHLAKLEITSLLNAMLDRIARFEVGEPVISMNNTLRGYDRLPLTIYPAEVAV